MDKHEQEQVAEADAARQQAEQGLKSEVVRDLGVPELLQHDQAATAIAGVWRSSDDRIHTQIVPPQEWDDPAVWGIVLADVVKHLVKQYSVLHPSRSKTAIQNRIVHMLNDELRS